MSKEREAELDRLNVLLLEAETFFVARFRGVIGSVVFEEDPASLAVLSRLVFCKHRQEWKLVVETYGKPVELAGAMLSDSFVKIRTHVCDLSTEQRLLIVNKGLLEELRQVLEVATVKEVARVHAACKQLESFLKTQR